MLKNTLEKNIFSRGEKIREVIRKHRLSQILEDTINWKTFECIFGKTCDVTKWNQVAWKAPDVEIEKPIARHVKNWKIILNKVEHVAC